MGTLLFLFLLTAVQTCRGFLFDDDADCMISQWTRWSQSSYGMRYRERKILRYPSGEGEECPSNLVDTDEVEIGARTDNPAGVIPEVLIITDGGSNIPAMAIAAAKRLKTRVDVYALAIGTQYNIREIASYVSAPISRHLFATPSYGELYKLVTMVENQMKTHPQNQCVPFITSG